MPLGLWVIEGKGGSASLAPIGFEPIPVSQDADWPTKLIIWGSGWRHAGEVKAWIGGVECSVTAAYPSRLVAGQDEIVIALPAGMAGYGWAELVIEADGLRSEGVRVWIGEGQ